MNNLEFITLLFVLLVFIFTVHLNSKNTQIYIDNLRSVEKRIKVLQDHVIKDKDVYSKMDNLSRALEIYVINDNKKTNKRGLINE